MLNMIIAILVLSNLIHHVSSIECFTCSQAGFYCQLPLNLDAGDESNENDIDTPNYDAGYACQSDHSFNPVTREEKLILRGISQCEEINIPNRRVHCCYTNHCNKQLLPITIETYLDSYSQSNLPSIALIFFSIVYLILFQFSFSFLWRF